MRLLSIFPEIACSYHKDICSAIFTSALLITTKNWKQPRSLSTEEQTKKMCQIYRVEYHSAIKNITSWNLQYEVEKRKKSFSEMLLSEETPSEKDKCGIYAFICVY